MKMKVRTVVNQESKGIANLQSLDQGQLTVKGFSNRMLPRF